MVFQVGIVPLYGKAAAYNEVTKETILISLDSTLYEEKIDVMDQIFKQIKVELKKSIGHTCIHLTHYYDTKSRNEIIKLGLKNGFQKVEILSSVEMIYICCMLKIEKPLSGHLIWILHSNRCYIWKKSEKNAKLVGNITIATGNKENPTKEIFKKIQNTSSRGTSPNLLLFDNGLIDVDIIKSKFPFAKVFYYQMESDVDGERAKASLIKARIMNNDLNAFNYDTVKQILYHVYIEIKEIKELVFKLLVELPTEKSSIITISNSNEKISFTNGKRNDKKLEFFSFIIKNSGEYLMTVKIDINFIFEVKYSKIQSLENIEKSLTNSYVNEKELTYVIPKEVIAKEINIIGIDLGTSRCCAAVSRQNGIQTVPLDNLGERLLPSYVSFDGNNTKCGQIVLNQLPHSSNSTVFDSKRIMGKEYNDVKINVNWPFTIHALRNKCFLRIQHSNDNEGKHCEEIVAVLLKHIKQKAEEFQGVTLNEVVITVPAAFTLKQKLATHVGASLAGWKTVHLLSEPVAASIAYFVDRPIPNRFTLLLFDFGGGTLDVCIFNVTSDTLKILSQKGDTDLGGRDFDNLLFDHFSQILKNEYKIDVGKTDKLKYRLMQKCMDIKHLLSVEKDARLDVSDFDTRIEKTITITRLDFEAMSIELQNKVKQLIIDVLAITNLTSKDIHKVLLSGGSSRMPMVQQLLRKMFIKSEHCCEEHPDEIVAIGAAYYASYINLQSKHDSQTFNKTQAPPPPPPRYHSLTSSFGN